MCKIKFTLLLILLFCVCFQVLLVCGSENLMSSSWWKTPLEGKQLAWDLIIREFNHD